MNALANWVEDEIESLLTNNEKYFIYKKAIIFKMTLAAGDLKLLNQLKREYENHLVLLLIPENYNKIGGLIVEKIHGFIPKNSCALEIIKALQHIKKYGTYIHHSYVEEFIGLCLAKKNLAFFGNTVLKVFEENPNLDIDSTIIEDIAASKEIAFKYFSQREYEIYLELARGKKNEEIASKLYLSQNTIKNYVRSIFEKLVVKDRINAIRKGIELGILFAVQKRNF